MNRSTRVPFDTTPGLGRFFSPTKKLYCSSELEGYKKLLVSTDREKVVAIARSYLNDTETYKFINKKDVTPRELYQLIDQIGRKIFIPVRKIGPYFDNEEYIHFRDNHTFINLPYGKKVTGWSDRNALQQLIRKEFNKIFREGDLVIIPGCADGQIPLEIYASSKNSDVDLEIVAADYNLPAMQLGYLTMKSFGLNADRIHWVQTDVKNKRFFEWIGSTFYENKRHQIVTLVQPSLCEETFLGFLKQASLLHKKKKTPTTVIMPVLLESKDSDWYQICDDHVQRAVHSSEKARDLPKLIWRKTKYGHEMLRLSGTNNYYIPQQYFLREEALPKIQKETGYQDFDKGTNKEPLSKIAQKLKHIEGVAKRVFCFWESL